MTLSMKKRSGSKGFTLIELLVVIAIIGVLASIVLASLNTARKKARDTRRVADMSQVKLALELYFDSIRSYPITVAAGTAPAGLVPTYIATWPGDPITGTRYPYFGAETNSTTATAADNSCTGAESCQFFHTGVDVEDKGIGAMASAAKRCSITTTPCVGDTILEDTTIYGNVANVTCLNVASTGGCYDVTP